MQRNFYQPERPPENKGISPATAVFISLLVAVVAFMAGVRVDDYSQLNLLSNDDSTNQSLPDDLDYSSVEEVYDALRGTFDGELSADELLNGMKAGLAEASGDPYTTYLNSEQAAQFNDDLNGTFTGIGAEIGVENELLIIVSPLDGFPAQEAGLQPKDGIIKIDGEDAFGLSIEEAVLKIRGPAGSDVTLTILRDGEQQDITITREEIVVPSVSTEIEDGIGYLRVSRFADDTAELTLKAAQEFLDAKVKGVILDLRNNSGGFLSAAVDVAELWIDGQPVVQQREDGGETVVNTLSAGNGALLGDIPTIVLVNEGSASASEIVAGALQDYDIAQLLGTTTFGKGSVQQLENFNDGSVLKVTIARWYTPNVNNIDESGIEPDIKVELTQEQREADRDVQRQRAERELQ